MARSRCSSKSLRKTCRSAKASLGRPVPAQCPAEFRITVPAHTRCKPPKRGQSWPRAKPAEPLLEWREKGAKPPRKKSEKELGKDQQRAFWREDAFRRAREFAKQRERPEFSDIHRNDFDAHPCTGVTYEDWKGNYNGPPSLKARAWEEQVYQCILDKWCEKHDCSDTSFNPADFMSDEERRNEFMDGLGRSRKRSKAKRPTKKRKATKKRSRR